jgi:hypothetical protein
MSEIYVIVHPQDIEEWARRDHTPLPRQMIEAALERIEEVKKSNPDKVIIVNESVNTGFTFLPQLVGAGNNVTLLGARAGYCLRVAREVLENAGIRVKLDRKGSLP